MRQVIKTLIRTEKNLKTNNKYLYVSTGSPKEAFWVIKSKVHFRAGIAGTIRLASVKCPSGLAFDLERQTCDWKAKVRQPLGVPVYLPAGEQL